MTELKDLNLKYNPFREITPTMDGDLIWAEMADVKTKIDRTYTDCINNNTKQLVLNWGAYGGGKTFSAYYFLKEKKNIEGLTQLYVRCPKDGGKATDEFFKNIIDFLSFEKISSHVKMLIEKNGEEVIMDFLSPRASKEYAKAICLMGSDDEKIRGLMHRFLYAGLTKTELKQLGLAKDIQSDSDSIKFLAGILSSFIGDGSIYKGRVVFWIDEMEDLIYYSSKHYKAFSQVLRDLFDSISDGFLVFMNFTLAEGEESTIELILGGAVWSRVTRKIRYKQFTEENALVYCTELLSYAKISKNEKRPFDENIIRSFIKNIPSNNITPREINKNFNSLLSYAIDHDLTEINHTTLNDWIKEYSEDN